MKERTKKIRFWLLDTIDCFCLLLELKPGVFWGALLQMSDAIDQMMASAHVMERSQRKKRQGEKRTGK